MRSVSVRLLVVALGLLLIARADIAHTASNTTPASRASNTADTITADGLKPSECAGITLTALVYGSGTINGSPGAVNELITGSAGADTINADGGDDCVLAGGGVDAVYAAAGNDVVQGGPGDDHLEGEAGDDTLYGDAGTDLCLGGAGTNVVTGCEQLQAVEIVGGWTTGLTHVAGTGSDRLLVFIGGMENGMASASPPSGDRDITAVTYGGQSLTAAEEIVICSGSPDSFCARVEIWYLDESGIEAASDSTFLVTWAGDPPYELEEYYTAVTLANVDQLGPLGDTSTNSTTTANPIQVSSPLTVGDGDLVVVGAFAGTSGSYTPGGAYTEGTDQSLTSSTMASASLGIVGAGTEQPSMQFDLTINRQVIAAAVFKVAPTMDIMLLVGNPASLDPNKDVPLRDFLETTLGHNVTVHDATSSGWTPTDYDAVVISESVLSADTAWLLSEAVGILTVEGANWDEFDLGTGGLSDGGDTTVDITDNSHYITSVFSTGNRAVATSGTNMGNIAGWGGGVQKLAHYASASTQAYILAVDKGGALVPSGTAAERRVFLGAQFLADANADGRTLLERALDWVAYRDTP